MVFAKWIIFIAFFVFAENAPMTEKTSDGELFYLNDLNNFTREMGNRKSQVFNAEFEINKIKFLGAVPSSVIARFSKSSFSVEMELVISLEIYLRDFDRYFETANFAFSFIINPFKHANTTDSKFPRNPSTNLEFPDLDKLDIKLKLPSDHQYKAQEKNQINQETKKLLKLMFETKQRHYPATSLESTWNGILRRQKDEFERLYSIRTIPSSNYTLNNLTIDQLGNIQKIVIYLDNIYRTIVGPVRGRMVQNFNSTARTPVELSFEVDTMYVSANEILGIVHIRAEGYSIVNTKSNTTLSDSESKSIMGDIEVALASFLAAPVESV